MYDSDAARMFSGISRYRDPEHHLDREVVLKHPLRRQIYELVQREPGTAFMGVVAAFPQYSESTVNYHLHVLEKTGLTKSQMVGKRKLFFTEYQPRGHLELALQTEALDEVGQDIYRRVVDRPGISQSELAAATGLRQPNTAQRLKRLVQKGFLTSQRHGRLIHYYPVTDARPAADAIRLEVPFHRSGEGTNEPNYCSEATVQMLLESQGHSIDQRTINSYGAFLEDLEPFITRYVGVQYAPYERQRVINSLKRGYPVALMLVLPTGRHKVLATGFTEGGQTLLVHDPDIGPHHPLGSSEPSYSVERAVYVEGN